MYSDKRFRQFGLNKEIPVQYEQEILTALSHYPELQETRIRFVLAPKASVPYGTKPAFGSIFRRQSKRTYLITILESAEYPESEVLFKKLEFTMKVGVLGHELGHVIQYENCKGLDLMKLLLSFGLPDKKREIERHADLLAIEHNLGSGLLAHALYIRSIPGYVKIRPAINRDYLAPTEIKYYMENLCTNAHAA